MLDTVSVVVGGIARAKGHNSPLAAAATYCPWGRVDFSQFAPQLPAGRSLGRSTPNPTLPTDRHRVQQQTLTANQDVLGQI
jgi:hypothetical protein